MLYEILIATNANKVLENSVEKKNIYSKSCIRDKEDKAKDYRAPESSNGLSVSCSVWTSFNTNAKAR